MTVALFYGIHNQLQVNSVTENLIRSLDSARSNLDDSDHGIGILTHKNLYSKSTCRYYIPWSFSELQSFYRKSFLVGEIHQTSPSTYWITNGRIKIFPQVLQCDGLWIAFTHLHTQIPPCLLASFKLCLHVGKKCNCPWFVLSSHAKIIWHCETAQTPI